MAGTTYQKPKTLENTGITPSGAPLAPPVVNRPNETGTIAPPQPVVNQSTPLLPTKVDIVGQNKQQPQQPNNTVNRSVTGAPQEKIIFNRDKSVTHVDPLGRITNMSPAEYQAFLGLRGGSPSGQGQINPDVLNAARSGAPPLNLDVANANANANLQAQNPPDLTQLGNAIQPTPTDFGNPLTDVAKGSATSALAGGLAGAATAATAAGIGAAATGGALLPAVPVAAVAGFVAGSLGGIVTKIVSQGHQRAKEDLTTFQTSQSRIKNIVDYVNHGGDPSTAIQAYNIQLGLIEASESDAKKLVSNDWRKLTSDAGDELIKIQSWRQNGGETLMRQKLLNAIAKPDPTQFLSTQEDLSNLGDLGNG
jgi:hypothetical protein